MFRYDSIREGDIAAFLRLVREVTELTGGVAASLAAVTPVPEPTVAIVMVLAPLVTLARQRQRRRR